MSNQVTNKVSVLFFIVCMFSLKKLSSPTADIIYVYAQYTNTTKHPVQFQAPLKTVILIP
jgi:hypothetical protein